MNLKPLWLALVFGGGIALAGCGTTGSDTDEDMEGDVVEGTGAMDGDGAERISQEDSPTAAGARSGADLTGEDLLQETSGPLAERIVYFEFDSSNVSGEYQDILRAHGEFLATHPEFQLTVEGHTDERGSREYNLALGERRARAVRQVLTLNGAASEQVRISSFGEEQPADTGHDESAWAENRRAELVYER